MFSFSDFNGIKRPVGESSCDKKGRRNYKLIIDPALKQGPEKVYRFDGDLPEVRGIISGETWAYIKSVCYLMEVYTQPLQFG